MTKYCKDCKWFDDSWGNMCTHPKICTESLIDGHPIKELASYMRQTICGLEAKYWEKKKPFNWFWIK